MPIVSLHDMFQHCTRRRRAGAPEAPAMALLLHVIIGVSFNLQWVFSSACVSQLHLLACGVAGGSHSALHVSVISSFT
jgi:hypothetical protein